MEIFPEFIGSFVYMTLIDFDLKSLIPPTSILLAFVGLLLLWIYLTRHHKYWSNRGIPGPTPLPFFGTYLGQFFIPFQDSEEARYKKYGKIYGIYDGTEPGLIIGDPSLIKQIMAGKKALKIFPNRRGVKTTHPIMSKFLSSLEDEEWKRVRSIVTPTFSTGKLKSIFPIMKEAARPMLDTLKQNSETGQEVELKRLFGDYTMEIIAKSAFATEPDSYFVQQASQLFTFPFWRKFLDYVIPKSWLIFLGFTVLPPEPMEFFRKITLETIRKRLANGTQVHDFLNLLMHAGAAAANGNQCLTHDEILSQSVLFFSVGFETSSQLLTYAAYCLALYPAVQDKVYAEIQTQLRENGNKIDHGLLGSLDYTSAVIDETLRLYNPVLRMERRASVDFVLENGIFIPKGMIIGIPVWALHHSEEFFPNPYQFKPERFLGAANKSKITPFTYLPFGDGPRSCIGTRFALLECKLALAEILLEFKFVKGARTNIPLKFFPTGRPLLGPQNVHVGVEKRQK